jgi:hypothetical protein
VPNASPPRDRADGPPNVERFDEFKKRCRVCGQVFDTRDQDQVFHHDANAHEPLTVNDK